MSDWTGSGAQRREQGQSFAYAPPPTSYFIPAGTPAIVACPDGISRRFTTKHDNEFQEVYTKFRVKRAGAMAFYMGGFILVVAEALVEKRRSPCKHL